jgi:hypothetical protein
MQDPAASVHKTLDTLFDDDDDDGDLMLLDDDVAPQNQTTHNAQTRPSPTYLSPPRHVPSHDDATN